MDLRDVLKSKLLRIYEDQVKVSKFEILRIYKDQVKGLYDTELIDDVSLKFYCTLESCANYQDKIQINKLIQMYAASKTDQEKVIFIDSALHLVHKKGSYAFYLVRDFGVNKDEMHKNVQQFLDELAGIANKENTTTYMHDIVDLIKRLEGTQKSLVGDNVLYSTIHLPGFEEANKKSIRNTQTRFEELNLSHKELQNKTVLDIGCNLGHMLFLALEYNSVYCKGLDHAKSIIKFANEIASIFKQDNISFDVFDVNDLSKIEPYDTVFCFAVDTYVNDKPNFYKELNRLTKETLYFEPNSKSNCWTVNEVEALFKDFTVEKTSVSYNTKEKNYRKTFILRRKNG